MTLYRNLKARRVASKLIAAFPDVPSEVATGRALRLMERSPILSVETAAVILVRGERTARVFESAMTQNLA